MIYIKDNKADFIADNIFLNSLSGDDLELLDKYDGETTADKLEDYWNKHKKRGALS